jgi:hypothetical protein
MCYVLAYIHTFILCYFVDLRCYQLYNKSIYILKSKGVSVLDIKNIYLSIFVAHNCCSKHK